MMKKSITVMLLCLLGVVMHAEAQLKFAAGIKGGVNASRFSAEKNPLSFISTDVNFRADFNAGIMILLRIGKFGIQPEMLFSRQGASIDYTSPDAVTNAKATAVSVQDYMTIPLVFKYYPIGGLNIQIGPQFGFLIAAKIDELKVAQNGDITIGSKLCNMDSFKDFDVGLTMGLGWDFPFGLTIDARYNMGLTAIIDTAQELILGEGKNQVIQFSIGYQIIRLGKQ